MNTKLIALLACLACSTVVVGLAGAQTTPTGNATNASQAPAGPPGQYELVLDESVAITDWQYRNGEFIIDFYSSDVATVTVAGSPDSQSNQGTISFRTVVLEADATTTVRVSSPTAVSMWTEDSREQGRAYYLRASGGSFIYGPYDDSDIIDGAIGGALGVAVAVLYTAVEAKIGASERGERVA